jgi:hypothetical protein
MNLNTPDERSTIRNAVHSHSAALPKYSQQQARHMDFTEPLR